MLFLDFTCCQSLQEDCKDGGWRPLFASKAPLKEFNPEARHCDRQVTVIGSLLAGQLCKTRSAASASQHPRPYMSSQVSHLRTLSDFPRNAVHSRVHSAQVLLRFPSLPNIKASHASKWQGRQGAIASYIRCPGPNPPKQFLLCGDQFQTQLKTICF